MDKSRTIRNEGVLDMNGAQIPCYVLEDGTRVLSARGMQGALKLVDTTNVQNTATLSGVELSRFIATSWFKSLVDSEEMLERFHPITCYKGSQRINGYEATVLVDFCDTILNARNRGLAKTPRQQLVAAQCEILIRAFAKVGIIALVDEATGYQYERENDALQKILAVYVSPEILQWQFTFSNRFYREIFRLRKWNFTTGDINKRPGVVGTYTNQYIYDMLPAGVGKVIKAKTPRSAAGNPTARYFQSLTPDIGYEHLKQQLITVTTLLSVARSWQEFKDLFARRFGQVAIDFDEKPALPKQLPPAKPTNEFDASLKGLLSIPPPPKPEKRKKKPKPPEDEPDGEQAGDLVPA